MSKVRGKWLDAAMFEQEIPSGTVNGTNASFTLSGVPVADKSVILLLDGRPLSQGAGIEKYTISGSSITMGTPPAYGQELFAWYIKK